MEGACINNSLLCLHNSDPGGHHSEAYYYIYDSRPATRGCERNPLWLLHQKHLFVNWEEGIGLIRRCWGTVSFHAFPLGRSEYEGSLHEGCIHLNCRDHTILGLLLNSLGLRGFRLELVRVHVWRVGPPYFVTNSSVVGRLW
jgi:hypothetical protein